MDSNDIELYINDYSRKQLEDLFEELTEKFHKSHHEMSTVDYERQEMVNIRIKQKSLAN